MGPGDAESSANIEKHKSFADDLSKERGIVSLRVAFVPRSTEIQPLFCRFVLFYKTFLLHPRLNEEDFGVFAFFFEQLHGRFLMKITLCYGKQSNEEDLSHREQKSSRAHFLELFSPFERVFQKKNVENALINLFQKL